MGIIETILKLVKDHTDTKGSAPAFIYIGDDEAYELFHAMWKLAIPLEEQHGLFGTSKIIRVMIGSHLNVG